MDDLGVPLFEEIPILMGFPWMSLCDVLVCSNTSMVSSALTLIITLNATDSIKKMHEC